MELFPIFTPNEPVMMVHRGWRAPIKFYEKAEINSHASSERSSLKGRYSPRNETPPTEAIQKIEFINGTEPNRNKDPEVRRLVRAHVVKDSSRKKKAQRKQEEQSKEKQMTTHSSKYSENSQIDISVENFTESREISPTLTGSVIPRYPRPPIFPSLGLDPHPQLSPIIYHITSMWDAMYPLASSFRFNPMSPASWFDWALSDEALFHALLYTTSTYAGLIVGTTQKGDSVIHVGKSVVLVNERLRGLVKRKGEGGMGIEDSTITAVSCMAITEVSHTHSFGSNERDTKADGVVNRL